MVPIIGERVRAALTLRHETVMGLKRRTGESQSTLDLIARGITKKCRRLRRDKIAKALKVEREWLSGGPLSWVAFPQEQNPNQPALAYLAQAFLIRRIHETWWRDSEQAIDDKYSAIFPSHVWAALLDVSNWRERLVSSTNGTQWSERASPEDRDEFTSAMARALEVMLRPWFEGKAQLNHRAVIALDPNGLKRAKELFRSTGVIRANSGRTRRRKKARGI